mmetsp:Transcript_8342/g.17937  ORF Transcript_8342/g.17937 Transcript_8342/m.17937 type:complete len:223 (+) Transcript_8342:298-966(+)
MNRNQFRFKDGNYSQPNHPKARFQYHFQWMTYNVDPEHRSIGWERGLSGGLHELCEREFVVDVRIKVLVLVNSGDHMLVCVSAVRIGGPRAAEVRKHSTKRVSQPRLGFFLRHEHHAIEIHRQPVSQHGFHIQPQDFEMHQRQIRFTKRRLAPLAERNCLVVRVRGEPLEFGRVQISLLRVKFKLTHGVSLLAARRLKLIDSFLENHNRVQHRLAIFRHLAR